MVEPPLDPIREAIPIIPIEAVVRALAQAD
jgi:hypothetical protein